MGLLASLRTWWVQTFGPTIRDRHDAATEEARRRAQAEGRLYDAYPDRKLPRHFWVSITTRGPSGRFIVEQVDLGWPIELTAWETRGAQRRVSEALHVAYRRVLERLEESGG